MKVQDLINAGKVTLEEVKDYIEGFDGWEATQEAMNEATGFNNAKIWLDTTSEYSEEDLLNARLFDEADNF